jgi:hypothetical protein
MVRSLRELFGNIGDIAAEVGAGLQNHRATYILFDGSRLGIRQRGSYHTTKGGPHQALPLNAPDWTRTSTPSRAQALNLPRIPIPPQGLQNTLYPHADPLSTTERGHV